MADRYNPHCKIYDVVSIDVAIMYCTLLLCQNYCTSCDEQFIRPSVHNASLFDAMVSPPHTGSRSIAGLAEV